MSQPPIPPEERYATMVEELVGNPHVTHMSDAPAAENRFGSSALKINGKIFAMLVQGKLVVKLPRQRVDVLIASGAGERFDRGHGRLMKEWLTVDPASDEQWLSLSKEAMDHVGRGRPLGVTERP